VIALADLLSREVLIIVWLLRLVGGLQLSLKIPYLLQLSRAPGTLTLQQLYDGRYDSMIDRCRHIMSK